MPADHRARHEPPESVWLGSRPPPPPPLMPDHCRPTPKPFLKAFPEEFFPRTMPLLRTKHRAVARRLHEPLRGWAKGTGSEPRRRAPEGRAPKGSRRAAAFLGLASVPPSRMIRGPRHGSRGSAQKANLLGVKSLLL